MLGHELYTIINIVVHAVCYELPLIWKLFIGLRKQTNSSLNPSNVPNNITATRCIKI